jgi:hypothetical protein
MSVSLWWLEFTVVPLCQRFTRITSFSSKKTVTTILPAAGTLSISSLEITYGAIPLIAASILVHNGGPRFHSTTVCKRKLSTSVLYWCKRSVAFLVPVNEYVSLHSNPQAQTLGQPSSSIIYITLLSPMDRMEYNSFVDMHQLPHINSSTW